MMYLGDQAIGIATAKYVDFNPYKYSSSLYKQFKSAELPEEMVIDFEDKCPTESDAFWESFRLCSGLKTLTIKNLIVPNDGIGFYYTFADSIDLETIIFENCVIKPTRFTRTFISNKIKHIYGPIDMSLAYGNSTSNASDAFYFARLLEDVEFVPNTIKSLISTSGMGSTSNSLTDASLISLCNGFNAEYPNNQPLNNATYLNRTKTIMGKNENGLFIADENGTLSLYDFVSTVKGWTLT